MSQIENRAEEIVEELIASNPMFSVGTAVIDGNELKVFENAPPSLREFFAMAEPHSEVEFLVYQQERYSFARVLQLSANFSEILRARYSVEKGQRVAIAMRNYPEWIISFMAITSMGAVAVPMNAWWTTEEFDYGIEDSGAKLIVADSERVERIHPLMDNLNLNIISVRCDASEDKRIERYEDLMEGQEDVAAPTVPIAPDDDATILYTSGSTGYPKGAVSTHRGIISALMTWTLFGTGKSFQAIEALGDDASAMEDLPQYQPTSLMTIPLFHVTGCHAIFLLSIPAGRRIVLMYKWDVEEALRLIEQERVTSFNGVPTMSWELLQSPSVDKYDLSSLNELSAGGAARPPEHVKALKEKFPDKSPRSGYGLTETNALGAVNDGVNYELRPGSTGRPLGPVLELKIVDDQDQEVPTGERGEILIRGPQNVRCYWNKPDATKEAFTDDGWFRTGDIGILDEDGFLYIVDRAKDIVIRGGENISCLEIEAAIYKHPDVLEVAVFGVPDERLGEELAAVITSKPGRQPKAQDIQHFLGDQVAKFKVPSRVWIQDEKLPRIASGKIHKPSLREEAITRLSSSA